MDSPKFKASCSWLLDIFWNVAQLKTSQQCRLLWKFGLSFLLLPKDRYLEGGFWVKGVNFALSLLLYDETFRKIIPTSTSLGWVCPHDHTLDNTGITTTNASRILICIFILFPLTYKCWALSFEFLLWTVISFAYFAFGVWHLSSWVVWVP